MKIDSISIKNFRGISKFKMPLTKLNVIVGENGSGKTSILESVRAGVTGKLPADTIKTGTSDGTISIAIDKLGEITRAWDREKSKTLFNGKATTQKSVNETIKEVFGISEDTLNIATSTEVMLGMSSGDFSKYLLQEGFMSIQTDVDQLVAMCKLSREAEKEIMNYMPEAPEPITPSDIDEAHKYYFGLRAAMKKEYAEESAKAKYEGSIPARTVEEIAREQSTVSENIGKLKATQENYDKLKKSFDVNQKALIDARAQVEAIICERPNDRYAETQNKKLQDVQKQIADTIATGTVLKNNIEAFRKILTGLSTSSCPVSEKLTCTTDKTAVSGEIEANIAESEKTRTELLATHTKLTEDEKDIKALLQKITENNALYQKKTLLMQQIDALEKADQKEPVLPDTTQLTALQNKMKTLSEELASAQKYNESQKAQERAKKAKARENMYDELTKVLAPKSGIRKLMIESSAKPLQEHMNDCLTNLMPDRHVVVDASDGFTVMVGDSTGELIEFGSISASEQIRIALVMFDMLNALSGLRILIIDNLDTFDSANIGIVFDYIQQKETLDKYDTIFLAGVSNGELMQALRRITEPDMQIITM